MEKNNITNYIFITCQQYDDLCGYKNFIVYDGKQYDKISNYIDFFNINYQYEEDLTPILSSFSLYYKDYCLFCYEEDLRGGYASGDSICSEKCICDDERDIDYIHIIVFVKGKPIKTKPIESTYIIRIIKGSTNTNNIENITDDITNNILYEFSVYKQMDSFDDFYKKILKQYEDFFFNKILISTNISSINIKNKSNELLIKEIKNNDCMVESFLHEIKGLEKDYNYILQFRYIINDILYTKELHEKKINLKNYGPKNKSHKTKYL
jgi:hypothetical protein